MVTCEEYCEFRVLQQLKVYGISVLRYRFDTTQTKKLTYKYHTNVVFALVKNGVRMEHFSVAHPRSRYIAWSHLPKVKVRASFETQQ